MFFANPLDIEEAVAEHAVWPAAYGRGYRSRRGLSQCPPVASIIRLCIASSTPLEVMLMVRGMGEPATWSCDQRCVPDGPAAALDQVDQPYCVALAVLPAPADSRSYPTKSATSTVVTSTFVPGSSVRCSCSPAIVNGVPSPPLVRGAASRCAVALNFRCAQLGHCTSSVSSSPGLFVPSVPRGAVCSFSIHT